MKVFIVLSVLALLFVVGSALALTAIGRNTPPRSSQDQQQKKGSKAEKK